MHYPVSYFILFYSFILLSIYSYIILRNCCDFCLVEVAVMDEVAENIPDSMHLKVIVFLFK